MEDMKTKRLEKAKRQIKEIDAQLEQLDEERVRPLVVRRKELNREIVSLTTPPAQSPETPIEPPAPEQTPVG